MTGAGSPPSWRSVKVFAFGLTFFVAGGFLFGISFVVQAMGSVNSHVPAIVGLLFMIVGVIVAGGRYTS